MTRHTTQNRFAGSHPPARHVTGGAQSVFPYQTLGDMEHCWCGLADGHDWPGKDDGEPHPQREVAMAAEQVESETLSRNRLRGYHPKVQDFILQCINDLGLKYRITHNDVVLYPLNDTRPISVHTGKNDGQLRLLNQWFNAHVEPHIFAPKVEEKAVEVPKVGSDEQREAALQRALAKEPTSPSEVEPEWVPYKDSDGTVIENFVTNGTLYRCTLCVGTPTEYVADNRRGIGGHNRMNHRDTSTLRTPEARAKGAETRSYNRLATAAERSVRDMAKALGLTVGEDQSAEVEELERRCDAERQRADEAEARLALMREAFEGLK